MKFKRFLMPAVVMALIGVTVAFTQSPAEQESKTDLETRILKLEARIEELEKRLNSQWTQPRNYQGVHSGVPVLPGTIEARLQRLEKQVFDPPVRIVPCE